MSDLSEAPWSNNPNAPQIPYWVHIGEVGILVGMYLGVIAYGIAVILFFQCMGALLNPINRARGGIKWWLVAHTVVMFVGLTLHHGISIRVLSNEFIDNRDFPGNDDSPAGPVGYDYMIAYGVLYTIYVVTFPVNQCLTDGFLLYRCYVVYNMNHWVIAFPCLLYLTCIGMGAANVYTTSKLGVNLLIQLNVNTSYFSISFALNVILTLMIVVRLILHRRSIRNALGSSGSTGTYTTIIAIIVESYALHALTLLLYVVPWSLDSWVLYIFARCTGVTQVIAPYLITIRVANHRALTSEMVSSKSRGVGSMRFRSRGTTDSGESLPSEDTIGSTGPGTAPEGFNHGANDKANEAPL